MGDGKDKKDLLSKWLAFSRSTEEETQETHLSEGPLSYGQERLYFLQLIHPDNPFYHYTEVYQFSGRVIKEKMISAFLKVVERHDILRTTFHEHDGTILQRVNTKLNPDVTLHNLKTASPEQIAITQRDEARRPFDLQQGPLVRLAVLDLPGNQLNFVVTMHHIITDKWSMRVVRQDWAHFYASISGAVSIPEVSPLGQRYIDYASRQKKRKISPKDIDFWQERLKNIPIELPIDHDKLRPKRMTYSGGFTSLKIPKNLAKGALDLAKERGVTPYVLFLAIFKLLISKSSQTNAVTIGSPISNRDDENLENVIGFFNETLVLHSELANVSTVAELLTVVESTVLEAFDHAKLPFEVLVKELKPERRENVNPLFQTMFLYHDVPEQPEFGEGIQMTYQPFDLGVAKFDLTMYVSNDQGEMELIMEYSKELFHEVRIMQMLDQSLYLLQQMLDPQARIAEMSLLDEASLKAVRGLGQGPVQPRPIMTVLDAIYEKANQSPEGDALWYKGQSITYGELIEKVESCAHYLTLNGAEKHRAVGVSAQPGFNMVIGLLAVMRMGGYYVPIDPEYPESRKSFMLQDAHAKVLLTDDKTMSYSELNVISFQEFSKVQETSLPEIQMDDLAYMIYTSGSSGKPKGVMVTHKNLLNSTLARLDYYGDDPCRFLLMSSFSFDSSVAGIFWSLVSGGSLILLPRRGEQDIYGLAELISQARVTHTLMLPTLYQVLLDNIETTKMKGLQKVILAGESSSLSLIQQHFSQRPEAELYNEYGPTEYTVWATVHRFTPRDEKVFIGRPINNTHLYVLDGRKKLVPMGQSGELFIAGDNLTNGYHGRPGLNDERFVDDPFLVGRKMYRTGDIVKFSITGNLEFIGRKDEQVKLRGYRIELGAIDVATMSFDGIENCKTIISGGKGKENLVLCYESNVKLDPLTLKSHLSSILPRYMVPELILGFERLPRLPNGKIDNTELLSRIADIGSDSNKLEAATPEEVTMLEVWQEVLKDSNIGVNDNFFAVGGDSIKSIQIIAKLRDRGFQIQTEDIFTFQTVRELSTTMVPIVRTEVDQSEIIGTSPFLPIHTWHFELHRSAPHHWSQAQAIVAKSSLSKEQFQNIINKLISHHDGLRSAFDDGAKTVSISTFETIPVDFILTSSDEIQEKTDKWLVTCQNSWQLEQGRLFRVLAFGEMVNRFVILAHHLLIDAISWNILLSDLALLWGQTLGGQKLTLPKKSESILEWSKAIYNVEDASAIAFWEKLDYNYSDWTFIKKVPSQILESNVSRVRFSVDLATPGETANDLPLNLKIEEAALICILSALDQISENEQFYIDIERNGREHGRVNLDVSSTIGWLTSMYTLPITAPGGFPTKSDFYIYLKELYRSVPNHGHEFGKMDLRKLLASRNQFGSSRIVYNYLGNLFGHEEDETFDEIAFLNEGMRASSSERDYLIEVNTYLIENQIQFDISYDSLSIEASSIDQFSSFCKTAMLELIEIDDQRSTPSDFPDIELDQNELDHLMDQF